MNTTRTYPDTVIGSVSFTALQRYLLHNAWNKKESKKDDVLIFYREKPAPTEIVLPTNKSYADYTYLVRRAIEKIGEVENKSIESIINTLLAPPSDIIRFSVKAQDTMQGIIPLDKGFSLLENGRKALFAAACDLENPTPFHKRMSYKAAQQFIDSCFLGQTERGSFITSIICPMVNETIDKKVQQLSLFDSETDLISSFTRQVTKRFMISLEKVTRAVKEDNYDTIIYPEDNQWISSNFLESIIELGSLSDIEEVDIVPSWYSLAASPVGLPEKTSITKDYIQPIESMISKLQPKDEGSPGDYVGKVSKASAHPDKNSRDEREITFNFVGDEDRLIKAKVFLDEKAFSIACQALDQGSNVKIKGLLRTSGRSKVIENPVLELVQ